MSIQILPAEKHISSFDIYGGRIFIILIINTIYSVLKKYYIRILTSFDIYSYFKIQQMFDLVKNYGKTLKILHSGHIGKLFFFYITFI